MGIIHVKNSLGRVGLKPGEGGISYIWLKPDAIQKGGVWLKPGGIQITFI
jgi:hypothetical protein